jgi:hypothetical protein
MLDAPYLPNRAHRRNTERRARMTVETTVERAHIGSDDPPGAVVALVGNV